MFVFLAKKLMFFILYALVIAGTTGLLFLDVNYLHNNVQEELLTEIFQEISLLIITTLLFYEAKRNSKLRASLILMAGFFSCLLIRELDVYFDVIFHGAWAWFAIPLALLCISYAVTQGSKTLVGLVHFTRHQSYSMMVCGLLCVLVFSRLFGMGVLWQELMDEHFNRAVKNIVEEGCEMLGYALCLMATFWYLSSARQKRLIDTK